MIFNLCFNSGICCHYFVSQFDDMVQKIFQFWNNFWFISFQCFLSCLSILLILSLDKFSCYISVQNVIFHIRIDSRRSLLPHWFSLRIYTRTPIRHFLFFCEILYRFYMYAYSIGKSAFGSNHTSSPFSELEIFNSLVRSRSMQYIYVLQTVFTSHICKMLVLLE